MKQLSKVLITGSSMWASPDILIALAMEERELHLVPPPPPSGLSLDEPSETLINGILGMTQMQKRICCVRSILDVPSKPETDQWYADRAEAKRERRGGRR